MCAKRDYRVGPDGKKIPSVTEIINHLGWKTEGLVRWAHRRGVDGLPLYASRDKAADDGNATHDIVAEMLGGEPALMEASKRQDLEPNATRIAEKVREMGWEVVSLENKLDPEQVGYAGTPDLIARNKAGLIGVVDFKTGFSGDETLIQIAGYACLWEAVRVSLGHDEIKWGACIQAKKGEPMNVTMYTQEQIAIAAGIFTGLVSIHVGREMLRKMKVFR